MRVLETRRLKSGIRRRTYLMSDDSKVNTYELPASVIKAIGMRKVEELLETWRRGEAGRIKAATLRTEVLSRPDWKPTALAHLLNITEARVRQIRQEARAK
jgi:hypothetical protein